MSTATFPSYESYRESWLESVTSGSPSTVELGNRFSHKLITQWRDVGLDAGEIIQCDGAGDGGIDLAFLYRGDADAENQEGHTWYLVQSKYGSAFRSVSTLLAEGHKVIETLDGRRSRLSSLAMGLLEQITNFRASSSPLDRIVLVYATVDPLTDEERRAAEDVKAMGRERLGPIFDVEAISVATIYERAKAEEVNGKRLHVAIQADLKESSGDLLIGTVSLVGLYEFLKAYKAATGDLDQLYEKNVRKFLGSRGKVNKKMHETLQAQPERFGLFNNGITIVVTDFSRQEGGKFDLVDPYVVNGCQTTRTIWEVCYRKLDAGGTGVSSSLNDWREKATRGVVATKVVKVGPSGEALLVDITRYTNTQNAIRDKDFLALRNDLQGWRAQMAKDYGVYLEIQRGGWESQLALQRQGSATTRFVEHANAFDLIKVYGAGWLGEPGLAFAKNAPFLPGGAVFERLQDVNATGGFDALDLYAAYRLDQHADKLRFGRGAEEPSRQQTRYLFYQIAIQLLREMLLGASLSPPPRDISRALLAVLAHEDIASELVKTAAELIDEYMREDSEESVYKEPEYKRLLNINAFLKLEKLSKPTLDTPNLRTLLALNKKALARVPKGAKTSPRDDILSVVRAALKA